MFYTIYEITNKINGKVYVGKHQTKNLDDGYMGSGKLIRRAISKYGLESFDKKILFVFERAEDMNLKEAEIVTDDFCLSNETYNLCSGGRGGFSYLNSHRLNNSNKNMEQISARISKSLTGRKYTEEQKEALKKAYSSGKRTPTCSPQYGNDYACKKVMCVATGMVYSSLRAAAQDRGCSDAYIAKLRRKGEYVNV